MTTFRKLESTGGSSSKDHDIAQKKDSLNSTMIVFSPKVAGTTGHNRQKEPGGIDPSLTQPIQLPLEGKEEITQSSLRSSQNRRSSKLKECIANAQFSLNAGGTQRAPMKVTENIELNTTAPLHGTLKQQR